MKGDCGTNGIKMNPEKITENFNLQDAITRQEIDKSKVKGSIFLAEKCLGKGTKRRKSSLTTSI